MNELVKSSNPFESQSPAVSNQNIASNANALVEAESAKAIQEIQASMTIAKRFPRDQRLVVDNILNACQRPTLAGTALYSYSRGGTEINGPSIRLAEAIAQSWGNMQFGLRELSSQNGMSTIQAYAWDVQNNTRQEKTFQVPHTRYTRAGGAQALKDPRDIYEQVANQGARRLRNCILGVIPGDVVEAAVLECEKTQKATIDVTPEAIKNMVSAFEDEFGVPQELIEKRVQKRIEAIVPGQMLSLRRIFQSLRDGMSKPSDWFEMNDPQAGPTTKTSSLTSEIKPKAEQEPEPEKEAPPSEPDYTRPLWVGTDDSGHYEDHHGNKFDPDANAMDAETQAPAMTATGKFKKLAKKKAAEPESQTAEPEQEPQSALFGQYSDAIGSAADMGALSNLRGKLEEDQNSLLPGEFDQLISAMLKKKADFK